MAYLQPITGGLILGLFMAISVGPTLFAIIKYSLNHSYRAGLAFVLGVSMSDIMFVTLANLAAPLLEALHKYDTVLYYAGGTLLIILGLSGLLKKYKPQRPSQSLSTISNGHYLRIWGSGFLINTINPAVIFNWITAVTIIANQGKLYRLIFFGCCLGLALGIDFIKVFLADAIRQRLTLRVVMRLQQLSSLLLALFGVFLMVLAFFHIRYNPEAAIHHEGKNKTDSSHVRPALRDTTRR